MAAFLPNVAETVIAMLGTSSIGAVWSSCSPDFGFKVLLTDLDKSLLSSSFQPMATGTTKEVFNVEETANQLAQQIESIDDVFWLKVAGRLARRF